MRGWWAKKAKSSIISKNAGSSKLSLGIENPKASQKEYVRTKKMIKHWLVALAHSHNRWWKLSRSRKRLRLTSKTKTKRYFREYTSWPSKTSRSWTHLNKFERTTHLVSSRAARKIGKLTKWVNSQKKIASMILRELIGYKFRRTKYRALRAKRSLAKSKARIFPAKIQVFRTSNSLEW